MKFYDHVKIGERIGWAAVNGYRAGVVRDITPAGVVVAVDGGGDMVLSTVESYRNFINKTQVLTSKATRTSERVEAPPKRVVS